jgi:hypothetical protein
MSPVNLYLSVAIGIGAVVGYIGHTMGLRPQAAALAGLLSAVAVFLGFALCYASGQASRAEEEAMRHGFHDAFINGGERK